MANNDSYCYLPLYVFCAQQLLYTYLRPSPIDGAQARSSHPHTTGVQRLRQQWPEVRIVFRGDSGFCRQPVLNYCERADVGYIIGLARNARLQAITELVALAMRDAFEQTGLKQREVGEFMYATQSWARQRRVISRLEFGQHANNPRYVVTNLTTEPQTLYDTVYCQRGEAENRNQASPGGLIRLTNEFSAVPKQSASHAAGSPGLRAH